jgi:hypothetical protein
MRKKVPTMTSLPTAAQRVPAVGHQGFPLLRNNEPSHAG